LTAIRGLERTTPSLDVLHLRENRMVRRRKRSEEVMVVEEEEEE